MKTFLTILNFFLFFNAQAATCPNLQGFYMCGLQEAIELPIGIQQQQNSEGVTLYSLAFFGDDLYEFTADGMSHDVPAIFDEDFSGTYSATCEADGLKMSIEGEYGDGLLVVPLAVNLNFTPAVKNNGDVIEGTASLQFQGRYAMANKEFFNGSLELKLSDDDTAFMCTKVADDIPEGGMFY